MSEHNSNDKAAPEKKVVQRVRGLEIVFYEAVKIWSIKPEESKIKEDMVATLSIF